MKKSIIILGLLAFGAHRIHSMEQQQLPLDKRQQKEFRATLAGCRSTYLQQQLLEATGRKENKAEARLRRNYEDLLNDYKQLHGNDVFVKDHLHKLEKFKNKEVPAIFKELNKLKTEDL
jgi:hypothetical protein